jgi:CRP-like cAMP-binding protein
VFALLLSAIDLHPALFVLGIGFPAVAILFIGPLLRADRKTAAKMRELEPRIALLQVLDLFDAASRLVLERLAGSVEVVELPADTDVVREGEPADALWIIADGEVAVTVNGEFVRTMGPRSYFGEIGLLRGIPRTATVRTTEPSVLWRLSGEDFLEAVQANSASTSLLGVAFSRLSRTHPRLADEPTTTPGTSEGS